MRVLARLGALALAAVAAGCSRPVSREVVSSHAHFVDVTERAGIRFTHCMGDRELLNIVESQGGGAAWLDYDNDGLLDLYLVNGRQQPDVSLGPPIPEAQSNRLYRNNGNGTFTDVTEKAGVGLKRYCLSATVADYDNDGWPDIYVSCFYGPNALYRNNRNGTFTEVARQAGVADMHDGVQAVFFDYDNDGWLDLYCGNYLHYDKARTEKNLKPGEYPGPFAYDGERSRLYHNNRGGTFTDVTRAMGLYRPTGKVMGLVAADVDEDGWVDLYQANDAMPRWLFHNERGKGFKEIAQRAGVAYGAGGPGASSMMAVWADYDNDGRLDLLVPDDKDNPLFHNDGGMLFSNASERLGIVAACGKHTSWGACFVDYDNDGWLDLFLTNGSFFRVEGERSKLLRNDRGRRFADISASSGPYFARSLCGRSATMADYDNDGRVDLLATNLNGPPVLLHNEQPSAGSWLGVRLVGRACNRDGIGAIVRVTAGGRTYIQHRLAGGA